MLFNPKIIYYPFVSLLVIWGIFQLKWKEAQRNRRRTTKANPSKSLNSLFIQGSLIKLTIGGIKHCKCMVNLRIFPLIVHEVWVGNIMNPVIAPGHTSPRVVLSSFWSSGWSSWTQMMARSSQKMDVWHACVIRQVSFSRFLLTDLFDPTKPCVGNVSSVACGGLPREREGGMWGVYFLVIQHDISLFFMLCALHCCLLLCLFWSQYFSLKCQHKKQLFVLLLQPLSFGEVS